MTEPRRITDAQTMRALAHPVRIALLEALQRDGELTATRAGELLGENPGNMSWHLQTLAKYGFIEEAPGAKGRSRPWRLRDKSFRFSDSNEDAGMAAAAGALAEHMRERVDREGREWMASRGAFPAEWHDQAFTNYSLVYLTADELGAISDELTAIFTRYNERSTDKELRPPGALPVRLNATGFPLPPTPEGN